MADFEAPWTSIFSLALSSPRPSSRTPSFARRITRAFTSDSALMVPLASSNLASIASWTRSRLISANASGKMLLKPRFGSRRCSGIWPPSKPLMRTPERAVWPLPPRPAVLPLPEPMPRPTRMRFLREPALSAISLSFIVSFLYLRSMILTENRFPTFRDHAPSILLLADDADEMLTLADHAANRRRVRKLGNPADLVEVEADQRRTLRVMAADCAAGLLDLDRLCGLGHRLQLQIVLVGHDLFRKPVSTFPDHDLCYSATASASPPPRRHSRAAPLMLGPAPTGRGAH